MCTAFDRTGQKRPPFAWNYLSRLFPFYTCLLKLTSWARWDETARNRCQTWATYTCCVKTPFHLEAQSDPQCFACYSNPDVDTFTDPVWLKLCYHCWVSVTVWRHTGTTLLYSCMSLGVYQHQTGKHLNGRVHLHKPCHYTLKTKIYRIPIQHRQVLPLITVWHTHTCTHTNAHSHRQPLS